MRYIIILIFFYLPFINTSESTEKIRKIDDKYVPQHPRYDIYTVVVDNIKLNDEKTNTPSARLNLVEVIRGKIDITTTFNNKKKDYIKGYWGSSSYYKDKQEILNFEGNKVIVYGVKSTNVHEPTFYIKHYVPYSLENKEIVLANKVSRIHESLRTLVFGILFMILILKIVYYFDPQIKKGYIRELLFKVVPYLLPLEIALYGYYHFQTSKFYNIRLDLLFLIPAFFATIIFSGLILSRNSDKEPYIKN